MKNGLLKSFSLILAFCMLLTSMSIVIVASDISKLDIIGGNVDLDLTNEGNVTVSVIAKEEVTFFGIEGSFDVNEQGENKYFTLTEITSECLDFSDNGNFVDVATGDILWLDRTFASPETVAANGKILTATYKVAANTPDGEYTLRFTSEVFTNAEAYPDETNTVFEAKITVTHKCKVEAQAEQPAQCETDGWKSYYKCISISCGKCYTDAEATNPIADFEAWKLAEGKIPATNHEGKLKKTDASPADCETSGNKEYYTCTVCGKYFADANAATEVEKDSWIIPATEHKWPATPTYNDNGDGTHTAVYICGNNAEHTRSDDPVAHVYVEGVCVCGADESLMKGDLDLDGDVDSDDLTLLARHIGGIEEVTDPVALKNSDVNDDGSVNSDDLTKHARYVGGIIVSWDQE